MPDIRDKKTRESVIKAAGGEDKFPTAYLQPKDGESKLLRLVREYEGTSPTSRFFASFTPFGKAARLKREFDKAGFGDEKIFNSEKQAIQQQTKALKSERTSEYGSISAALAAGQIPEQIYGAPSFLPKRESIYSNVGLPNSSVRSGQYDRVPSEEGIYDSTNVPFKGGNQVYGPAPNSVNYKTEYGPAPTLDRPIYDKVPPISVYGSVKDLEVEGQSQRRPAPATPPEFFAAVREGNTDKVKGMLENHPALINAKDEKGKTALQVAKQSSREELAKYLEGQGTLAQKYGSSKISGTGGRQR